jgi:pimeloyl-ACP methyl ester carboxylesterase
MGRSRRNVRRALWGLALVALASGLLASGSVSPAEGAAPSDGGGRRSHVGEIDGADYRVEVPERWNGTLVLYSHGYYPVQYEFPPTPVSLSNAAETEEWLVDHGFAVAASNYESQQGYQVDDAQQHQLALLDWFEAHVGRPDRTISMGQSMGAAIAVLLAERHPDRFDGVMTVCGGYDTLGTFNAGLDVAFAVRTLLTDPGEQIDLVHPRDPAASTAALVRAVEAARTTPQGRARLALIASLNNVTGWWSALAPPPATDAERLDNQANWLVGAYVGGFGSPYALADLEAQVGGNPTSNVGVDYRRQLARSSQTRLVEQAYRQAGADLEADLDLLDAAPRIAADPAAVDHMHRTSIARGRTPVPVITMHSTGDGGAVADQERWYAEQVRRHGDPHQLRQLYVDRGQHCSFSAADEVTALQALLSKIETGRWPSTSPHRLNAAVSRFDPHFQQVLDLRNFRDKAVMPPAFTRFTPPEFLRPSR